MYKQTSFHQPKANPPQSPSGRPEGTQGVQECENGKGIQEDMRGM